MDLQVKKDDRVPLDDEKIVGLYFDRNEKAIDETDFKYGKYLFSVAYNILCDRLDCEECMNDTYLDVWNAIPPTRPNSFSVFLTVIMRRTAINKYHSNTKKSRVPSNLTLSLSDIEDFVCDDGDIDEEFDAKQLGERLSSFINSLDKRGQYIFISRYYMSEKISQIAKDLKISKSTVEKKLYNIRQSLKEMLIRWGYII